MGSASSKWNKVSVGALGECGKRSSAGKAAFILQLPVQVSKKGGRAENRGRKNNSDSQDREAGTGCCQSKGKEPDCAAVPDDGEIREVLDLTLLEWEDCQIHLNTDLCPKSSPGSNSCTWSDSGFHCQGSPFSPVSRIQMLAGKVSPDTSADLLFGPGRVQLPHRQEKQPAADPASDQVWATALGSSNLNVHHWNKRNLTHDLFTTQDIKNNNMASRLTNSEQNVPPNSTPVLYDYSEELLMASIEDEYS